MMQAENDGLYLGTLKMMAIKDRTTSYEGEIQKALRSPHYANGWQAIGYAPRSRFACRKPTADLFIRHQAYGHSRPLQ
jgi:hypothetical protein